MNLQNTISFVEDGAGSKSNTQKKITVFFDR